jgi:hypothetical protein
MARIRARKDITSADHRGVTYEPDAEGYFDVPDEFAAQLVQFHGCGPEAEKVADDEAAAEARAAREKKRAGKKDDDTL